MSCFPKYRLISIAKPTESEARNKEMPAPAINQKNKVTNNSKIVFCNKEIYLALDKNQENKVVNKLTLKPDADHNCDIPIVFNL